MTEPLPPRAAATSGGDFAISVILPHYNDLENLGRCLDLLADQRLDVPFEVIVADNNSTCDRGRLEAVCRRSNVRLVDAPRQGAAEARNVGVEASGATRLAFIDSDCLPGPDWLGKGLRALDGSPLVGGRITVGTADPAQLTPAEAFERIFAFNNERYLREEKFSVTANMFTTRAVFDRVGGFRNGVSEDVDWGQRAAALGYDWHYAPEACLEHPARRTWPELTRKWKRLMRESYLLDRERGGGRGRWLLRNWLVALSIPVAMMKALRSREVPSAADRFKAAAVVARLRLWRFAEAHRLALRASAPGAA